MKAILVTGGAGYIGSHVCKALKKAGFVPVTFDNLSHGHEWAIRWGPFVYGDLQNSEDLDKAFLEYRPEAVIHLAGSIHLRESIENPYKHYFNNVIGSLSLLKAMVKHNVLPLVFSSSAAVYAPPQYLPMDEKHPKDPINPYGKTKWMTEQLFEKSKNPFRKSPRENQRFSKGSSQTTSPCKRHGPENCLEILKPFDNN